jgi:hypothetical protein
MRGRLSRLLPSRRWAIRIVGGVLLSFAIFVLGRWIWWEYTRAQGEKELAAAITETGALDSRWRWEQIEEDREQVPDEENSILVMKRYYEALPRNRPNEPWNSWSADSLKMPNGEKLLPEASDNRRLDDDRLSKLMEELNKNETSLEIARSLKGYPRGRAIVQITPNVLDTRLPHVDWCRSASDMLVLDIEQLLHRNGFDKVWSRVTAILHTGAGLRGEWTLILQLVRIAVRAKAVRRIERILAMGVSQPDSLRNAQAHLLVEESEDLLKPAIRGERAMWILLFENLDNGRYDNFDGGSKGTFPWDRGFGWKLYRSRLPEDEAYYLRAMNQFIRIAGLPSHEQLSRYRQELGHITDEISESNRDKRLMVSGLLLPAVEKVAEAAIRDRALLRCAITALAAERFRIDTKNWPKSPADLCPKYINEVPIDPFDGLPLKHVARDDGLTIYSVGVDGQDDGGRGLTSDGREKGSDLGFQLWDVDKRGKPATPQLKEADRP